jgi:hypothetical protein
MKDPEHAATNTDTLSILRTNCAPYLGTAWRARPRSVQTQDSITKAVQCITANH